MKERLSRKSDWRALYPPADDAFAGRMERLIAGLPRRREETKMRKKLSTGLILAAALALLTVGALAAAGQWGVMDYLFGNSREAAEKYVQSVSCEAENELVRLNIDSALCDGQYLAFDWTITPLHPSRYARLSVETFTANGVQLFGDGTDDFDGHWLPSDWNEDGSMQDGDTVELPQALYGADTLDIEMIVGVYESTQPVFVLPDDDTGRLGFNAELAREKIRAGYAVIHSYDGWVVEDAEETDGIAYVVGFTPRASDPFTRTELRVHFTVDVAACAAAARTLRTEIYETEQFTARYDRALLTPLGLYLDVTLTPKAGVTAAEAFAKIDYVDGGFTLTDGAGRSLEMHPVGDNEGSDETHVRYHGIWFGLTREDLPEKVSLSYLSDDGSVRYVFPVSVE